MKKKIPFHWICTILFSDYRTKRMMWYIKAFCHNVNFTKSENWKSYAWVENRFAGNGANENKMIGKFFQRRTIINPREYLLFGGKNFVNRIQILCIFLICCQLCLENDDNGINQQLALQSLAKCIHAILNAWIDLVSISLQRIKCLTTLTRTTILSNIFMWKRPF